MLNSSLNNAENKELNQELLIYTEMIFEINISHKTNQIINQLDNKEIHDFISSFKMFDKSKYPTYIYILISLLLYFILDKEGYITLKTFVKIINKLHLRVSIKAVKDLILKVKGT